MDEGRRTSPPPTIANSRPSGGVDNFDLVPFRLSHGVGWRELRSFLLGGIGHTLCRAYCEPVVLVSDLQRSRLRFRVLKGSSQQTRLLCASELDCSRGSACAGIVERSIFRASDKDGRSGRRFASLADHGRAFSCLSREQRLCGRFTRWAGFVRGMFVENSRFRASPGLWKDAALEASWRGAR
jgi:hypothetical protein